MRKEACFSTELVCRLLEREREQGRASKREAIARVGGTDGD